MEAYKPKNEVQSVKRVVSTKVDPEMKEAEILDNLTKIVNGVEASDEVDNVKEV